MKRATYDFKTTKTAPEDFNPRPREEGDANIIIFVHNLGFISIHALVKRATRHKLTALETVDISIHALVKRATVVSYIRRSLSDYFNPRPREEGDSKFIQ